MSKIAIVTGAAGGMGIATVERLSADGFHVAALDLNEEGLAEAKERASGSVDIYVVDLTDETMVRATIAKIQSNVDGVDALVNLVGWVTTQKFVDEDSVYWRKIIDINLMSVLFATHACLPGMIERKSGKIVTVTSDAGKVGQSGEAVYAAAKGGLIAWSKSMARELARFNINVNCTAPGPTDTPLEADQDPEIVARILKAIPFRRMAQPSDQAAMISFLCSSDSDYITGQTYSVSGGLTMS